MSPTRVLAPRVGERLAPSSAVAPKPVATSPAPRSASGAKIPPEVRKPRPALSLCRVGWEEEWGKGAAGWGRLRGPRAAPRCPE